MDPGATLYGMVGVDWACAPCEQVGASLAKASASTSLTGSYDAGRVLDSKLDTAWCEGASGLGVGQTLRLDFEAPLLLDAIAIYGGYLKSPEVLEKNGRVRAVEVRTSAGTRQTVRLADPAVPMAFDPSLGPDRAIDPAEWFTRIGKATEPWVRLARRPGESERVTASWVELELQAIWPGSAYEDSCISEVVLLHVPPEVLE